ncbi:MAG: InlB B-repeat-containing protein [Clostridia bacterium]|nr:InlB B-repeat-containing protein [Clostridia bacterium]
MKKRILSFILCICMLITSDFLRLPVNSAEPETDEPATHAIEILHDGTPTAALSLYRHKKETLTAVFDGTAQSYQWQILANESSDIWVNIYDRTEQMCDVSFALVTSLLNEDGCAYLRCAVVGEDNVTYYSSGIRIQFLPDSKDGDNVTSFAESEQTGSQTMFRMARAANAESEFVNITIKYLDISTLTTGIDTNIYNPYVAHVEKGSAFHQNVVSPTFLGFAPYIDTNGNGIIDPEADLDDDGVVDANADKSAATYELNYATGVLLENVEIRIYYKPIKVKYAARYFFQNINDDLYTENEELHHVHEAETGTIISSEELEAHAGNITGFEKMYHIPDSVAADGSTVFECYYDRVYHLILFDNNGGYGVDPIYARYGAPFLVNDPIKYGYVFAGWDLLTIDDNGDGIPDRGDGNPDDIPSNIPAEDRTYIAIWETKVTDYTIVYWKENANDNGYTYWGFSEKQAMSSSEITVDGNTIGNAAQDNMPESEHFTFNPMLSDKNVVVAGDGTTVVNAYYTRNRYSITFVAPGLCTIEENHVHSEERGCYVYRCEGKLHIHGEHCTLICTKKQHNHGDDDCLCTLGHIHTAECCSLETHIHDASCCTLEVHTEDSQHTYLCWDNVGNSTTRPSGAPNNPQNGQIYVRRSWGTYYYYIYVQGRWYNYTDRTVTNGVVLEPTCHQHDDGYCLYAHTEHDHTSGCNTVNCPNKGIEHNHTEGLCACPIPEYTHTDECYDCIEDDHVHTEDCLLLACGIPQNHSHTSTCNNASSNSTVKIVHRKYEQSLEDIWPITDDNGKVYNSGERWDPSDTNIYTEVLVFIATMPKEDFTLTLNESSNSTKTMKYYLEVLPGEEYDVTYDGHNYKLDKTISANYNHITKAEDFFDIAGFDQYASDPKFSNNQITSSTANFYYNRTTSHRITFNNNGYVLEDKTTTGIMVGASITHLGFIPSYPPNLEPNAYYFGGWYTSPGCFDGTKVTWSEMIMPDNDIAFYAKWLPKSHTVRFFTTLSDLNQFEADNTSIDPFATFDSILHGNIVGTVDTPVRTGAGNMEITFAGWFFIEAGQKKAFAPLSMPINRDINIFADWGSHSPQPFLIQYVLQDNPEVKVADDMFGHAYAGSTRTFQAKAGYPFNQLYSEYNQGYFPIVASHSITIQYEEDTTTPHLNVFTFSYVKAEEISYRINYINRETNLIMDYEDFTTTDAVVTARFKTFTDMVPDAFYKRLVISVVWDEEQKKYVGTDDNVINFYYTPNSRSAYYAVHYMLEKPHDTTLPPEEIEKLRSQYYIDGSGGYESTGTHVEGIGDVGETVSIYPQKFAGFELIDNDQVAISVEGGEQRILNLSDDGTFDLSISATGTELYIFYKRLPFDYKVHYYEYNTTESLLPTEEGTAHYDDILSFEGKVISGYTCVNKTQTLQIREKEEQNVVIFYYAPEQYVVQYVMVAPTPTIGNVGLSKTIEVKMGNEEFEGSTPIVPAYYEFVGWYLDAACTLPVTEEYGTIIDHTFVPKKEKLNANTEGDNFYYAKFQLLAADLTITQTNAADENQMFVYHVFDNNLSIFVTILGNNSVTIHNLPLGEYTVSQENGWSWRYTDGSVTVDHTGETVVPFDDGVQTNQWLSGNSYIGQQTAQGGSS